MQQERQERKDLQEAQDNQESTATQVRLARPVGLARRAAMVVPERLDSRGHRAYPGLPDSWVTREIRVCQEARVRQDGLGHRDGPARGEALVGLEKLELRAPRVRRDFQECQVQLVQLA